MADPVNYCSLLYPSFCISQSEWATWTQAGLTVVTFVIALIKQHRTDIRSAQQKSASDAALLKERKEHSEQQRLASEVLAAEKLFNMKQRAKALAISLRAELIQANSVFEVIKTNGLPDTPSRAFKDFADNLSIRTRAVDVLDLGEHAPLLHRVIDAAESVYNYLKACRDNDAFTPANIAFIEGTSRDVIPDVKAGMEVILFLIRDR